MSLTVVIHKDAPDPVIEIPNWSLHEETSLQFTGAVYLTALGEDYTRHNLDLSNPVMKQLFFQTIDRASDAKIVRMQRLVHQISTFTKLRKVLLACLIATIFAYVFSLISLTTSAILFLLIGKALKWRDNAHYRCRKSYENEDPKLHPVLHCITPGSYKSLQLVEPLVLNLKNRELFEKIAQVMSRYSRVLAQFHRENCETLKQFKDSRYDLGHSKIVDPEQVSQSDTSIDWEFASFREYPLIDNAKSYTRENSVSDSEDPLVHADLLVQTYNSVTRVFRSSSSRLIYSIDPIAQILLKEMVLRKTLEVLPSVIFNLIQEYAQQPDNHKQRFSFFVDVVSPNFLNWARNVKQDREKALVAAANETQKKEDSTVVSAS